MPGGTVDGYPYKIRHLNTFLSIGIETGAFHLSQVTFLKL